MTWVKICATTNSEDALVCVAAGADAIGFIFADSKRRIAPEPAAALVAGLPAGIEKIGIFINESPARVAEVAEHVGLTGVQLHGDESPEKLQEYRRLLQGRRIIKTLQARELLLEPQRLEGYVQLAGTIDAVLLDSGTAANRGGTGVPFDWTAAQPIAARIRQHLPLIVAGGLHPENVAEAIRLFEPYGVDVVSGVEREVGKKDPAKVKAFVAAVQRTRAAHEAL